MYVIESKVCGLKFEDILCPLDSHSASPFMMLTRPLSDCKLMGCVLRRAVTIGAFLTW